MATTRIKDLSKTATTVNSDANLVLDGNTGGTQKITRDNFRQDTADAFVAAPGTYNLAPINSGTGKIDATYLPTSSDTPKGAWNASTNTPTLADGSGTAGDYYDVTVAGSSDLGSGSITFTVGDVVKYDGTTWFKIDSVTNILDGVSTIDGAKAAIEIPDVGTDPSEVPLNQHLGSMAYQSADSVSVAELEVTDKVDGNLGINTTPTATLEVTDATTNVAAVRVTRRSDLASTYAELGTTGGSGEVRSTDNLVLSADFDNNGSGSVIEFKVDGSQKAVIDSSGRVGIGTSSPVAGSKLEVVDGDIQATTSGSFCYLNSARATVPASSGYVIGGTKFKAYSTGTTYNTSAEMLAVSDGAWSASSTPTYLQLSTTPNGSTTPAVRWVVGSAGNLIAQSGVGIDFGSGASTTLDAYEEGLWSATLTPATSGTITLAGSVNALRYTIVGRVAHIQGKVDVTAVSSPVGNYVKVSLPTAVGVPDINEESGSTAGSVVVIGAAGSMNDYRLLAIEGDDHLRIYKGTGSTPVATAADFNGNEEVYINATYIIS